MSREEEIPQEEEDNLNESSGEGNGMYSWDELEYKVNYVCFISNESTERQVQIASVVEFPYISLCMHPIRPQLWSLIVETSLLTITCKNCAFIANKTTIP